MIRTVVVDGKSYEVTTDAFVVGEWVAAQNEGGLYIQGVVTRVKTGVVTIKEEGISRRGRRPLITVPVECVYMRRPADFISGTTANTVRK